MKHNQVLHERVILLTVAVEDIPYVEVHKRLEFHDAGQGFYRMLLHYGFMEEVDIPRDLAWIKGCGPALAMPVSCDRAALS